VTTLIIIALLVAGLIVWLVFLLKPKTKKNKKKPEDQKKEPKKKEPPRAPEDVELAKKMDEFVVMNPKYTTELVRGWLNQTRKRP
jgi:type VI protein secretion system component VasK